MNRRSGPTISIVIPTFEDGEWLGEGLRSAWQQTLPPAQVIVVDDGSSSPQALAGIDRALAAFPATRLIRQANAGPAAARNLGLAHVASEFIVFLDADDSLASNSLELHSGLFANVEGIVATYGGFVARSHDGGELRSAFREHIGAIEPETVGMPGGIPGGLSCYMFRADAVRTIGGLDKGLSIMEDFDLLIRLGRSGATIAGCNTPIWLRNLRPGSLSRGAASRRMAGALKFLAKARRERYFSPKHLAQRYYHVITQHLF